jgi:drug/metabolite transporter (DMT)-like permease
VSRKQAWAAFWLVGIIWGSSFLLIRIGVQEFTPVQVVFIRTAIAAIGLNTLLFLRGKRLPTDWRTVRPLIIIGLGNVVAPFLLISTGEQSIDSGIASVLQSTASLFTLVIAHFAFEDERITPQKIAGLITGFIGVVVLASREWKDGQIVMGGLLGQLAIVGASLCYATFTTYGRKVMRQNVEPLVLSTGTLTTAAVVTGIVALVAPLLTHDKPLSLSVERGTLLAMLLLGFVNTFIAYIFYYSVVKELGAARASMVTYIVPVVGLILGVSVAGEIFDWRLGVGALLIFSGIGLVNLRMFQRSKPVPEPAKYPQYEPDQLR